MDSTSYLMLRLFAVRARDTTLIDFSFARFSSIPSLRNNAPPRLVTVRNAGDLARSLSFFLSDNTLEVKLLSTPAKEYT